MGEKWPRNFAESSDFHVTFGSFTCCKARRGTDGFTSPPKEGVLRILKDVTEHKCVFFSLQLLSETFLTIRRTE
jgi:hypothetical protein